MYPKVLVCEISTCTFLGNFSNSRAKRGKVKNDLKQNISKWLKIWALILVPFERELKMLLFKKKLKIFEQNFKSYRIFTFFEFREMRFGLKSEDVHISGTIRT